MARHIAAPPVVRSQLCGCNDQRMVPAIDPVHADPDPHIVLGIVADPGAAFALARELADTELNVELDQRLPGARWCIEVVEGRLVQPPATDDDIVKAARKTLLDDPCELRRRRRARNPGAELSGAGSPLWQQLVLR